MESDSFALQKDGSQRDINGLLGDSNSLPNDQCRSRARKSQARSATKGISTVRSQLALNFAPILRGHPGADTDQAADLILGRGAVLELLQTEMAQR
jgi:hypothetical protein